MFGCGLPQSCKRGIRHDDYPGSSYGIQQPQLSILSVQTNNVDYPGSFAQGCEVSSETCRPIRLQPGKQTLAHRRN